MNTRQTTRTAGFTLIELLIVIAIIGILAGVMLPKLLGARQAAFDRAALAYAHNVYKAGQAYVAEDVARTLPAGNCGAGTSVTSFGSYSVTGPGMYVTGCTYTAGAARVVVTYTNYATGATSTASVGQ